MIAFDSSVVIASFGAWHEHHDEARAALSDSVRLPAHAGLEAYAILTRLPEPFRAEPPIVADFLARTYPSARLILGSGDLSTLPARLADLGIAGGAVYDALIAITAATADVELLTLDRRALPTYARCGVRVRLLA